MALFSHLLMIVVRSAHDVINPSSTNIVHPYRPTSIRGLISGSYLQGPPVGHPTEQSNRATGGTELSGLRHLTELAVSRGGRQPLTFRGGGAHAQVEVLGFARLLLQACRFLFGSNHAPPSARKSGLRLRADFPASQAQLDVAEEFGRRARA